MEGRRVSSRNQKYNPLFILFLCLVAAILVLLILSLVLGIRLGSSGKKLKAANAQITQLEQEVAQLQDDLAALRDRAPSNVPETNIPDTVESGIGISPQGGVGTDVPPQGGLSADPPVSANASGTSWLDLSGHSEVRIAPTKLLDGYATYYTTAGVNLRSGPATSYGRITTVDFGEPVQVAAKEGNWSFVKTGKYFGWISSDYLSTKQPTPAVSTGTKTGGGTSSRTEATSGSLKTR